MSGKIASAPRHSSKIYTLDEPASLVPSWGKLWRADDEKL
jgi:hypothetical protein